MARRSPPENGAPAGPPPPSAPEASPPEDAAPHEDRPNLPAHVVRFGLVRACVWENRTEHGVRHAVTVSRLYKGGDGLWYSSTTFWYRDLLTLAKALDAAHSWVAGRIASAADVPF